MNEKVIRLINILQDRFDVPMRTDGGNILMTRGDLEHEVNGIWPRDEDTWNSILLDEAIANLGIPNYVNFYGVHTFILVRK